LDIGCGGGRTTKALKDMTADYTGIDYSGKMIAACRKRFKSLKLIHCDASDLSVLGHKKYNFILFSFNGLDSMSHGKRIKTLNEIHRHLKNDGIYTFSSHNRDFTVKVALSDILGKNILRNIRHFPSYMQGLKHQTHCESYEIISDPFDFGYLIYCISKLHQVKQLEESGFKCIEILNRKGQYTEVETADSDSNFFYYICKKSQ